MRTILIESSKISSRRIYIEELKKNLEQNTNVNFRVGSFVASKGIILGACCGITSLTGLGLFGVDMISLFNLARALLNFKAFIISETALETRSGRSGFMNCSFFSVGKIGRLAFYKNKNKMQ